MRPPCYAQSLQDYEHEHLGLRVVARERQQKRRIGTTERVHALKWIADERQVAMARHELLKQRILQSARVLHFID